MATDFVIITTQGLDRIPGAKAGDRFVVECFTASATGTGKVAHVRDQGSIWSLGVGDWKPVYASSAEAMTDVLADEVATLLGIDPEAVATEPRQGRISLTTEQLADLLKTAEVGAAFIARIPEMLAEAEDAMTPGRSTRNAYGSGAQDMIRRVAHLLPENA